MKRYIIGGIAGFLMASAISAHAAEIASAVGKVIQGAFPIKIDGKALDTPAIVVDGTSYLPVRAFGEATGYDVSFDADLGISLKKKEQPAAPPQPSPAAPPAPAPGDLKAGYKAIASAIFSLDGEKAKKSTGGFSIIQVDGAQYVSLITLSSFYTVDWKDPLMEFSLDGKLVTRFPIGTAYTKGTGAFNYDGAVYVNLSLLNLKGIVSGDALVMTEQF